MIFHEIRDLADFWKFTMEPDDVMALECAIVEAGDGDYLEIGVQQGGSACFVGRVKKLLGHVGKLYGVDSLQNRHADREKIEQNVKELGLDFTLIVGKSDVVHVPVSPVVTLIDGDHAYDWVRRDWERFSRITQRFILLHDVKTTAGPKKFVAELAESPDPRWRHVCSTGNMAIFERCASF
jgi:cephalosporin hydroxylase